MGRARTRLERMGETAETFLLCLGFVAVMFGVIAAFSWLPVEALIGIGCLIFGSLIGWNICVLALRNTERRDREKAGE